MTAQDDLRVRKALQGLEFPADRSTLLSYATTREAAPKTLQALRTVPEQQYDNVQQVLDAVHQEPEGEPEPGGRAR